MTATAQRGDAAGVSPAVRSDRRLWIAILVLSLIGTGVAGYLTYVHYEGLKVLCLSSGGCETVQASRYAKLDGVPVAVLGLAGYVGILGSLAIRGEFGRVAGFAIALIGFGFSMYLTYRELFTIKAICPWCVSSAVIMTVLAILTAIRAVRYESATV
ncbi:MAG: vitamin K epoxide reductase family protein [Actinomycetota bacterium]|nr:vitamin K epoxide reductase family protein [Actinomycetota bacterium]